MRGVECFHNNVFAKELRRTLSGGPWSWCFFITIKTVYWVAPFCGRNLGFLKLFVKMSTISAVKLSFEGIKRCSHCPKPGSKQGIKIQGILADAWRCLPSSRTFWVYITPFAFLALLSAFFSITWRDMLQQSFQPFQRINKIPCCVGCWLFLLWWAWQPLFLKGAAEKKSICGQIFGKKCNLWPDFQR